MPGTFPHLGHVAKLARLRTSPVNQFKIRRYFRVESRQNALTGVRLALRASHRPPGDISVFASIWGPPFPVRENVAAAWSSIANPGATFNNYVNYIRKACYFPGRPTAWVIPALINVIMGLRIQGESPYRFPNFIAISCLVEITRRESKSSEFSQLAHLSFLCALWAQSEGPPIKIRELIKGRSNGIRTQDRPRPYRGARPACGGGGRSRTAF